MVLNKQDDTTNNNLPVLLFFSSFKRTIFIKRSLCVHLCEWFANLLGYLLLCTAMYSYMLFNRPNKRTSIIIETHTTSEFSPRFTYSFRFHPPPKLPSFVKSNFPFSHLSLNLSHPTSKHLWLHSWPAIIFIYSVNKNYEEIMCDET